MEEMAHEGKNVALGDLELGGEYETLLLYPCLF